MDISNQKRMAANILKCGHHRVMMDPNRLEDISEAVTRKDVRKLISSGAIIKKQKKGISRSRILYRAAQKKKGRRRGSAHRRGGTNARFNRKLRWMLRIRPIRIRLRELRADGTIDRTLYRALYLQAKGGMFHNRSHLDTQLRLRGVLKTELKPSTKRAEERRKLRRETARSVIMPSRLEKGSKKLRKRSKNAKKKAAAEKKAAAKVAAAAEKGAPPEKAAPAQDERPAGEAGRREA
jgi:large subunit ribosomal protein L19e